jgi:hypothetical protein
MRSLQLYLLLDSVYRVEDQLFHVEDQIRQSTRVQLTVARLRTNSVWGATVAGALAVVPTLLSAAGEAYDSFPAVAFYVACAVMVGLWVFQIHDARKAEREVGITVKAGEHVPLWQRDDYLLEQVAMFGARIRVLHQALDEERAQPTRTDADAAQAPPGSLPPVRIRELLEYSVNRVREALRKSEELVSAGARTQEQHATLRLWAEPYLRLGEQAPSSGR